MPQDKYNRDNPHAVFGITERTDWTDDERSHVRGLASSSMAKADSSKTSWQYMREAYPDQEAVALGARGPSEVAAQTKKNRAQDMKDGKKSAAAAAGRRLDSIDGTAMETGSKGWLVGDDCQACKMYETFSTYTMDNLPDNFDWRDLGAVSAVTNQKYCGSCWSFSTAQDIEGTRFLATGELIALSEQQQVACDTGCDGCDGGWPYRAMQYASQIGGLLYAKDYPYKGICAWDACDKRPDDQDSRTPVCDVNLVSEKIVAHNVSGIEGYQLVAMGADYEEFMRLALVKNGPLSMSFNAVAMDYYEEGITGCSSDDGDVHAGCISHEETCDPEALDHAVLIVGYGTENEIPCESSQVVWCITLFLIAVVIVAPQSHKRNPPCIFEMRTTAVWLGICSLTCCACTPIGQKSPTHHRLGR